MRVSRREVLGLGLAAATAFSVGDHRAPSLRPALPEKPGASPKPSLPVLVSSVGVTTGTVQKFRSRPDLAPAAVRVDINRPGQDDGFIFIDSHLGPGDQGPMIVDSSGQLVWFQPVSHVRRSPDRAFNLRVQQLHGKPVLTWFDGDVVAAHGQGEYVIMSSSYEEIARVRAGNGYSDDLHAFLLTPENTAFFTSYGVGYADFSPFGGKANAPYLYGVVQEVDLASREVIFQWRSDEHVSFGESYAPLPAKLAWDYFHVNSIGLTRDGNLLISGRNTWTAYKVERSSGRVLWRMGGKKSDFTFSRGAHFSWQHDVNEQPDGTYTVFDNGVGDYKTEAQSRGMVLAVDEGARRVTLRREFLHPRGPVLAGALGSVQLLPSGHALVGWGVQAAYTEYTKDGTPILDAHLAGQGVESYRAFRQVWTGFPLGRPAIAVDRLGSATTVYASWNGATQVTHWAVLAGKDPSALVHIGTAERKGFETIIKVPHRTTYVAVTALDGHGRELGRSNLA